METDDLQEHLSSLVELCKCSVCLEDVGATVVVCTRGHGVCATCRTKLQGCPTCSGTFLTDKPTMLVKLLEKLPRACVFYQQGCRVFSSPGDHIPFCGFRSIKCADFMRTCSWNGTAQQYLGHLQTNRHKCDWTDPLVLGEKMIIPLGGFDKTAGFQNRFMFYDDNIFLLVMHQDLDKRTITLLVKHVPVEKPKYDYYFQIYLKEGFDGNGVEHGHSSASDTRNKTTSAPPEAQEKEIFHLHTIKAEVLDQSNNLLDCPYQITLNIDEIKYFMRRKICCYLIFAVKLIRRNL